MLPRNVRQEMLSLAYVRAVAARAGVQCVLPELDFGFDLYLRGLERDGHGVRDSGPQIDVQIKSTSQADLRENEIAFDLEVRAYHLLRPLQSGRPRFFILMLLPDDEQLWLNQTEEQLVLRKCAYWLSLRGAPATRSKRSVRVLIPRANLFDAAALQQWMAEANRKDRS
jgi:Domain of unknown function (DUF4365)